MGPPTTPLWRARGFFAGLGVGVAVSALAVTAWFGGARWNHAHPGPAPHALVPTPLPTGITDAKCAAAFGSKGDVADVDLYDCAKRGQLGTCHIWQGCPTCACAAYAGSEGLCGKNGKCGFPLNGTGCVSSAYYGRGNPEFGCEGTDVQVGACMMRRLLRDGYCTKTAVE